jgi:hypothetical protein
MPKRQVTDQQIVAAYKLIQSTKLVAAHLGISERALNYRRKKIAEPCPVADHRPAYNTAEIDDSRAVYRLRVEDGIVLIGSDIHVWPGRRTTMQRAFIQFARTLKPAAVICNGDVFDGASISRHPSIGWESKPSVAQELEAVQDFLGDLTIAAGNAKRIWPAGNHDLRFESKVAAQLPEFAGVKGVHLKDHLPGWAPCWRCDINDDIVVKHRGKGGEHADWNNVVNGGKTIVTGHDHRVGVVPFRDYRGIRWGVRCGYMGETPLDAQFVHYLEASEAVNWHPGFVVLSFHKGRLLWPEIVTKHDDEHVEFRGQVIRV